MIIDRKFVQELQHKTEESEEQDVLMARLNGFDTLDALFVWFPFHYCTHVTGPVSQSSAENDYNTACTAGMELENSIMQNNELMNKHAYVVPEQAHLIILNRK